MLQEVDAPTAFVRLAQQHSILELVWHMANWKAFAINRLQPAALENLQHFEALDWQPLDHRQPSLWPQGLQKLQQTQQALITLLQQLPDAMLEETVRERPYNYRKLLTGILQHDIYHLAQIALLTKVIRAARRPEA